MAYEYMEQGTGKLVVVTQEYSGTVTIYIRAQTVCSHHGSSAADLQEWAEQHIESRLDPILSREDFKDINYHIAFGMSSVHSGGS